ncbi:MAG: hypothetical protein FJ398_05205 [Verrucomicrobia bacterium]|nr:hypothetical protein [Verrucomicrobiota bacterium]
MSRFLSATTILGPCLLASALAGGVATSQTADREAPAHNVDGSVVQDWLVLGPFPSQGMETDFLASLGGEANLRPKEGESVTTADGRRLSWTRLRSKSAWVNLGQIFGIQNRSVAYAYCQLESDQSRETTFRFLNNSPASIWLDGTKLTPTPTDAPARFGVPPVLPIKLREGRNSCLVKLKNEAVDWQFLFQPLPGEQATVEFKVTDPDEKAVADALIQFYEQGEVMWRVTTDASGQAEACRYPLAKSLTSFSAAALLALPGSVSAISRRREARLEPRRE